MQRRLEGLWLGRQRYLPIHALQERLFAARREQRVGDTVLFLEHELVITLGRGAKAEHVLLDRASLEREGFDFAATGRGGDVTVHGPGQLVCYPILDLAPDRCDVRKYVRDLTETMRRTVAESGIDAGTIDGYVGLWADAREPSSWRGEEQADVPVKLGAIGVRISRWITMHGFALNLEPDLSMFRHVVPCGIREHGVSSVAELVGAAPSPREAAERAFGHLAAVLGAEAGSFREMRPGLLEDSLVGSVQPSP
jgi:lipoyl(octanoyl) transferase